MKKLPVKILLLIILAYSGLVKLRAQERSLDSLRGVWNDESQSDSNRLMAVRLLSTHSLQTTPDSAFHFSKLMYDYANNRGMKKEMAIALRIEGAYFQGLNNDSFALKCFHKSETLFEDLCDSTGLSDVYISIGITHYQNLQLESAAIYFAKSLEIKERIGEKRGVAANLTNLGAILNLQGNQAKAAEYYFRGLQIAEELGDSRKMSLVWNNLGTIYYDQLDLDKSLECYENSLRIKKELNDHLGVAYTLMNIGNIYDDEGASLRAIETYQEALKIGEAMMNKGIVSMAINLIGTVYEAQGNLDEALKYYQRSSKISREIGQTEILSENLTRIARIQMAKGELTLAHSSGVNALNFANESGIIQQSLEAAQVLYEINKILGHYRLALDYLELRNLMRDSIVSEENQREVLRQEYKYEYEKEALADSLVFAKKEALSQAEIKRKNQQRNALMGGLGLISIFSGLLYNRFRVTRKQKQVIEVQKAEVEEQKAQVEHKNEEIMASITYARKLQTAVLPPARVVKEFFSDSFLLYLPRDIVSGDFYWMETLNSPPRKHVLSEVEGEGSGEVVSYFAVADCTGHGVPGAMLSVIGMNGLNRALNEQKLTAPKDILTSLSDHVQRHFEQSESTVRDGMDICLCALDNKTKKLTFAGANNPVWIARNGEMHILNGDRRAIGHHNTDTQFTQREFQLQDGDVIYLSSDGYQDQLGGPKARKLMKKVFREKLLAVSTEPLETQRESLLSELELWQQHTPQTDDICVMGIRV